MAYTATDVKNLRERTGAGMMDCKKAMDETGGDMEAAVDLLRAKGLAAVAKNDQFQDFVRKTTEVALSAAADDVEALKAAAYPGGGTVADTLTQNVATIGENQQVRRMKTVSVSSGLVVPYMHNAAAPMLGKIGVLVALESEASADVLESLGKQIAMHIAAAFPMALSADDLDPEVLDRERKIALEKATEEATKSGKEIPADILAKRADGAAAKFAKDNALLSQIFVMDNKTPVAQVVEAAGKAAGTKIVLKDYVRFQLGEGIEKVETDFAAEVAAAAGLN
jgi:elongation factor Ts